MVIAIYVVGVMVVVTAVHTCSCLCTMMVVSIAREEQDHGCENGDVDTTKARLGCFVAVVVADVVLVLVDVVIAVVVVVARLAVFSTTKLLERPGCMQ